ncbi:hypothetical protein EON65_04035 [archaeon]|nr:MAG: hypothetical protein EON65_04035 [archaeon]
MDDNTLRGDAKVGSGKLDIRQGCAVLEKTTSISITVLDDKGKKAGRLTLAGALFQPPDENTVLELPKDVNEGFLRIHKISGKELKTGNFFSSPAPSIEITYGTWKSSTTNSDNYSPIWTGLELESPSMHRELLLSTAFQLVLMENKKVIATAEVPNLLLACSRFRQPTLMSFPLQHVKSKTPAGTVDIELCILPTNDRKVDTTKEIQIERKVDYTDAELNVRSIHLKNLRNTEWMGQADPFIILSYADWMEQTAPYKDAGSEVVWNDLSMRADTTANELMSKELEVAVYDKNSMRANALIGKMKLSLKRLAVSPGKEIIISDQLLDTKGKSAGTCEIRAEVRKLDTKNLPKLPEELSTVELHCFCISAFDLKNTEIMGKQDPFVILKVGEGKMQSPVQMDAGSDTIFENLDMRLVLPKQALQQEEVTVEVWDQNNTGNRLIGKGKASLRTLRTLHEERQVPVTLFTTDGSSAGRLLLALKVGLPPLSAEDEAAADSKIVIPPSFQTGWLDVVRIVAHGLRNTAFLDGMLGSRQDPYVELSLGDWKDKSEVKENGGKDCTWDLLDLSAPVTADTVRTGTMEVIVKNKGTVKDEVIGQGTCKVLRAAGRMNEEVLVKIDLTDKKNKPAGKIELFLNLHEDERDADYKIPRDFTYGVLKVTAIETFHLKNTEFFGKQDPFVELLIGEVLKVKTFTKENAGVQASWEHLPYQCDLYREVLESAPMDIIVSDENTARPNALIGKGSVTLVKCAHFLDKDVTVNTLIYDSKNKVSGKVRLHCKLSIPEPEADIPADFVEGTLRIMQVSAFGLQRTEFFGLSKTDPYAVVTLNGTAKKTKVLNNHGGNPSWERLDFEYQCDNRTARVGEISVDLMDANSLAAHTKLGSASILVKKFGSKMGFILDINGQLLNSKGQLSGEIVLKGQLEARQAVAKIELGLPEDFTTGYISIVSLQAKGLKNTELLGKSDPFAKFEIGDWEETTTTLFGAGSNPSWPQLDCQAEVNRDVLANTTLKLTFSDQNLSRGDKMIGFGSASLRPLCERVGKIMKLTIPISDSSGAVCGEAVVNAVLKKGDPSQMIEALPESAVVIDKGVLKMMEVAAYDLGGGDKSIFDNKPDPYIVFQVGDSKDLIGRTSVLKDGGRNPRWSSPDIEFPVSKDILVFQRLNVLVMDKNNLSKDSFMGKGHISLRKAGSDASGKSAKYVIRLKDMRGRAAGRLEVVAAIEPLKDVVNKEAAKEEFSQVLGQLQIAEIEITDARNTAMIGKQDLYVKLSFPNWTGQTEVNKEAGTKSKWNVKIDTKNVVAAHLQRHGLKVQVLSPGITGDSTVGDCTIPMDVLIDSSNDFTELRHQLMYEGKPLGKVRVKARFTTDEGQLQQWAKSAPQAENSEASSAAVNQELLRRQMSSMESTLKDQIKHELSKERKEMMAQLEAQNKELKSTLDKLSRSMSQMKQDNSALTEIKDVELPKNIARWRTAHVQAWLAFELELPQYLESFASASIDGLVLMKHVDEHILKDYMNITDILHSTKLLAGIENLKMKQQRYEEHVEKKRLAKLAEEEERKKRLEALKAKEKKEGDDSKKPKKPKASFGEVRESNLIDRARIEHAMTACRAEQQLKKEKADRKSKTWHFEYTGQPKPDVESVWDSKVDARIGSQSYQKAMTSDIAKVLAPIPTKIRTIPVNCSTDEVLAIIKGAMFEVSSWLLEVEQLNFKRRTLMDHDLLAMDMHDLPEYDQLMTDLAAAEDDEPLEDPPSYGEFEKEGEGVGEEENFSQTHEPPPYEEVLGESLIIRPLPVTAIPPGKRTMLPRSLTETATAAFLSQQQPITDRMVLIFRALVKQQNNDARWLGANSKLTRLKLYGGIESLLRLRLEWSQFDTIWTKLDYKRSGDIDLHEFKQFFGDLSDFEQLEGTRSMNITSHAKSITALTRTLYELCDALRHAKFTVAEMFSGFDRNGSGDVSVSEFCSMLRTVLGNSFDKKLIYQALSVLDMDGNKAISLEETLFFIYRIWRTQLDDLANKIYRLNEIEDAGAIKKLLDERQAIKQAIKKNFPRQWRDKLEREGLGHAIPGPFHNLLKKLHVNDEKALEEVCDSVEFGKGSYPTMSTRPPAPPQQTSSTPMLSPSRKPGRTYLAGKSTMLRFKVRLPPSTEHDRYRVTHTTSPPKKQLDNMVTMSAEGVHKLLTSSDPLGGFN